MDKNDKSYGDDPQANSNPNWTIEVSDGSPAVADLPVSITEVEKNPLLPHAPLNSSVGLKDTKPSANSSAVEKAEDMVSTMLAKGYILGMDVLNKAKSFDERHQLTSNASTTAASIDRKIGLSEKLSLGAAVVNIKVREMDVRFQFSDKAKSAVAAAEQKASNAGSVILSNRFVSTGASWVSSAIGAVTKAAEGVTVMTKEKVERAEEEKREALQKEQAAMVNEFAHILLDESSVEDPPVIPIK